MNAYIHWQKARAERDPVPEGEHECEWYGCANAVTDRDFMLVRGTPGRETVLLFCCAEHLQKYIRDEHEDFITERELGN